MKANPKYINMPKHFWAHVRSISEELGYTVRGSGTIKIYRLENIVRAFTKLGLDSEHLRDDDGPSTFGQSLLDYFSYRADVLNKTVQHHLMDVDDAEAAYIHLKNDLSIGIDVATPMNKQKGEKKKIAYLTAMVNLIVFSRSGGYNVDYDPRSLTTFTRDGKPLRTLARRVDGAFPSAVNPIAIWEIKEYYHTKTFGSRVADGVYETLLDGMELEDLREAEQWPVQHCLIVDSHFTWWKCGRSYLCRIIDMLHMGYVDEVLFGREVLSRLPSLVDEWVALAKDQGLTPTGAHIPTIEPEEGAE